VAVGSQFARYINPLLAVLKNLGGSAKAAEAKGAVADFLRLSDDVLEDRLESGSSRFDNQVAWARYYLARAGYIDASRRGVWALTEKGRNTPELTDEPINDLVQGVIAEWVDARRMWSGRPALMARADPKLRPRPPTRLSATIGATC
jgi:restriction system protein